MSDNIKVVVKVRPLISREIESKLSDQWRVINNTISHIDSYERSGHSFTFDKVYDKDTRTSDVYNDIAKPIVEAALAGFNGTIFAYGQTSSGKTYTMTGTEDAPGIIPLAVVNLFDCIKEIPDREFLVRASYVEIYNETLIDLLDIKKPIKISETYNSGVKVDATERLTTSPDEILKVMQEGKVNRQMGSTNMNEESSRSHSIFQITIESREHIEGGKEAGSVNVSQLNLVDLAGSERAGQTGATGIRFKEGTHINKSLSALALVIKQLSEDPNKHVNYRDSKLTRILQNSLGGNAKTGIICAVTPATVEETISTLQFASRAKSIKNSPAVNIVATDATMIQNLTKQLSTLKTQLEGKKTVEQDNHNLQNKIARLQSLILNGFVQRSNADMLCGTRRKLNPPRRVTISTLHPIEEDPIPVIATIPKFCTPSLKYNPMTLPSASEFLPIQKTQSLSCVTEEPRLVTPPPRDKKVNFNDEVIEIDSDDDSLSIQPCSPYHKCFESSKTPPCILRKNAKLAEKNLKDIVELTEREKLFKPSVVELMEQLETKVSIITKLEDDVNKLRNMSSEKDIELEKLRSNIEKVKQEISSVTSSKENLEDCIKNYETKLTDLEVSYESLKNKARIREQELLSLLRDHSVKKTFESTGMNTSVVYIENERNTRNTEQEESLLSDIQAQLIMKEETIEELEKRLSDQTNTINILERSNREFQEMLESHRNNIDILENEHSSQADTIKNLHVIIKDQKILVDNMTDNVNSLNNMVQDLQLKLSEKDKILKEFIVDIDVDDMLVNEEIMDANNDNLKNIVHSLKINIQNKKEELNKIKSKAEQSSLSDNDDIQNELENSRKKIISLTEEITNLKLKYNDNNSDVDQFSEAEKNVVAIEQDLNKKISEILEEKSTLEKQNEMYRLEILELKECNDLLNIKLAGSGQDTEHLKHQLELLNSKIMSLESDIENKSKQIIHLEEQHRNTQINLDNINLFAKKLQVITNLLSGNMSVPEIMDDLVVDFADFSNNLQSLENASTEILKQKKDMLTLIEKQVSEIDKLQLIINDYDKNVSEFCCECKTILEINHYKENNHCEESKELCLDNDANNGCDNLKYNFKNLINLIKTTKTQMSQLLEARDVEIKDLISTNINKDSKIKEFLTQVSELDDMVKKRDTIFNNILQKCLDLTLEFSIENNVSCEFSSESENTFENIILILDKISNYINILNASKINESDNINDTIVEAKTKIVHLTQENLELLNTIHNLEDDKNNLSKKIKEILIKNQDFALDLRKSKELIYSFKSDVESNMTEFKYGFNNLNEALKEYMEKMKTENSDLLFEISKTRRDTDLSYSKLIITDNNHDFKNDTHVQLHSPPRLSTICCKTVIEAIDAARESDASEKSIYESSSLDSAVLENICQHEQILSELEYLRKDNTCLKHKNEELQSQNEDLMKEHEMLLKEVQLLIESSHDLQKKVVNHRTNLSTLMATTYAENKSLTSQIKFLQHYYSRFYNVCQKDIPDFKKQLQDLLVLLRSENFAKHNESFKRYSLPNTLDSTSIHSTFRNESILDGDLLMLDTNVSLTTCDNTLLGPDQTGLEVTQIYLCNEVACQTNDSEIISNGTLHPQVITEDPTYTTQKINDLLDSLKEENDKLRKLVEEYNSTNSKSSESNSIAPATLTVQPQCMGEGASECTHAQELRAVKIEYTENYNNISEKLIKVESQKADIELKYNKLNLDVPNIDALTRKLNAFEKEMQTKQCSIDKLTSSLNDTKKEMAKLEVENDDLSNQIMEYVSEIDHLKAEHKLLSDVKTELANKCSDLEKNLQLSPSSDNIDKHLECLECKVKDQVIGDLKDRLTTDSCTRLNRSYSDSESSSRYNKFCTLQNELHAGREDCIELKEDVTTIKNHLEGSPNHQAMDLDISMGEPHLLPLNEDITGDKANNKNTLDTAKEYQLDIYNLERVNCFNYYIEKIEGVESIPDPNMKIIDIMKMFYENMLSKHSNEVENLRNRLRDFEEGQHLLENQVDSLNLEKSKISNDLKNKDLYLQVMAELMLSLKNNLNLIKGACNQPDIELQFKENFLHKIDKEFGLESLAVFETVVNFIHIEHGQESQRLEQENYGLLEEAQNIRDELSNVKKNVSVLQSTLAQRESEYNLLCQQKERIHEVSNAVTLDIISKDRELREIVKNAYKKLSELNILDNKDLDFNLPLNEIVKLLFEYTFSYYKETNIQENINQEKHNLMEELSNAKNMFSEKEKQLESLKNQKDLIERNISEMQQKMQQQINLHTDLMEIYEKKVDENASNVMMVNKLTEEVDILKEDISKKEIVIKGLENKLENEAKQTELESLAKLSEVLQSLKEAHEKIEELKIINEKVIQEKETLEKELTGAGKTIAQNKLELDKVNTDIMILKESVREYSDVVEKLKSETKILAEKKAELHNELQEKCNECSQLQVNIKTHEKTAEIQSKMIIKTRKQKDDAERSSREKDVKLEELSVKCKELQEECDQLAADMRATREEMDSIRSAKDALEARVSELQTELEDRRGRMSIGSLADGSRRRRQSIHDAKRMCNEIEDEKKLDEMFKPHTPAEDMFMDVDNCSSSRSTPMRFSRGRDSISSRHDQSEEEAGARARSRRRSVHDRVRLLSTDQNHVNTSSPDSTENTSANSELQELRKRLSSCEEELSELRERYRELDEECETCAQYLRSSEEHCKRLKREKALLESTIEELNKKLSCTTSLEKPVVNDAHVNTDEDWTNLHSVIVDRMSYDAEVEKNKKLTKIIEELRYNKQHLRSTIDKMQKALDKHSSKDRKELETIKSELKACKQELAEYKERCKELDEECETCAEYLRERDQQCRKLKEAKAALESKLQEYAESSPMAQSVRKKRQSLHDRRRGDSSSHADVSDAATDTPDDLVSYQAEKDNIPLNTSNATLMKDYERLKTVVQRLSAQKAELEEQLRALTSLPVYVATGSAIVQKQQITDVLKENQKLKKINAKLITMCKKRGKTADANTENEDPSEIKT